MNRCKRKYRLFGIRRGVEAVEAAMTLPLLTIVMFGTVQICHRWHVEKLLKIATVEAVKAGASVNGGTVEARAVFADHTEALGIEGAWLWITNTNAATPVGSWITGQGLAPSHLNRLPCPVRLDIGFNMSSGWVFYRKEGL